MLFGQSYVAQTHVDSHALAMALLKILEGLLIWSQISNCKKPSSCSFTKSKKRCGHQAGGWQAKMFDRGHSGNRFIRTQSFE